MPDVDVQSPRPPQPAEAHKDPHADTEPLLHLYKMSTTAGLGSQEYVAVNVTSVVAILLGFASLLALLDNVLLIIPLLGVGVGWLALRQVSSSSGTQTGRGLALLGIILSVMIGGGILVQQAMEFSRTRADHQAIANLCDQFGNDLRQKDYPAAYDCFDSGFKARVDQTLFSSKFEGLQHNPYTGPVDAVIWGGRVEFNPDPDSGVIKADGIVKFHYAKIDQEERLEAHFIKVAGKWLVENLPAVFPAPRHPPGSK